MTAYELLFLQCLLIAWALGLTLVTDLSPAMSLTIVTLLFFFGLTIGIIGGNL